MIGDCVQAKIEAGIVAEKDTLLLMPQNVLATVKGMEQHGFKLPSAHAGLIVDLGLKLPSDFDSQMLSKGTLLCSPEYPAPLIKRFMARVLIFKAPLGVITKGDQVMVHSYMSKSPGKIAQLVSIVDVKQDNKVLKERPKSLKAGMVANIKISLTDKLCLEKLENYFVLGRIILRHENHTIAGGVITELLN